MSRIIPKWIRKPPKGKTQIGLRHGFRSGLEDKIGDQITEMGEEVVFEKFKLPYIIPAKKHMYTPDFRLRNGILVEAKGIFDATDRAKHLFVKEQYPELDIRFVFSNDKAPINPGSKTTLAMWCEKYGYKYSKKLIPPEWFSEEGPSEDPLVVIARGPWGGLKKD